MANYQDIELRLLNFEKSTRENHQKIVDLENMVTRQRNLLIWVDKYLQDKRFPEQWLMKEIREVAGIL